jgi:hypothetical protein
MTRFARFCTWLNKPSPDAVICNICGKWAIPNKVGVPVHYTSKGGVYSHTLHVIEYAHNCGMLKRMSEMPDDEVIARLL